MNNSLEGLIRLSGAKHASGKYPVEIVVYNGAVLAFPEFNARYLFDIDSVIFPERIPLDIDHNPTESIGYLDQFRIDNYRIIAKGFITPYGDDEAAKIVYQLQQGIPFQASLATRQGYLTDIDAGQTVYINNQIFTGPFKLIQDWVLNEVAICKRGKDSHAMTRLAASLNKKNITTAKDSSSPILKDTHMENTNNENEVVETPAVAPAVEVAAPASEPVLEASVESVASETVEPQAEVRASELPAAETVSTEPLVASVDPRAEFKAFVAKFGSASAAEYFAAGLTMPEATEKHLTLQSSKIKSLEARLASADRGLPAAVELTASETDISEKPAGLKDLIQLGTKK